MMSAAEASGADDGLSSNLDSFGFLRDLYFTKLRNTPLDPKSDRKLASLVLEHAKNIIAHPSRPTRKRLSSLINAPFDEIAFEETLEENPELDNPALWLVEKVEEKPFSCVAMLDLSSSMAGEKHLLSSIAVAVLLLELSPKDSGLVAFSSQAKPIKRFSQIESHESTLLRFLQYPTRGFTNISKGLEEGLKIYQMGTPRGKKIGLIATDGRATEGANPIYAAEKFDFLVVLHLHGPGSYLEASQQMAHHGKGFCLEVNEISDLPKKMYDAVRLISRR
jgi:Mg-chelatase subunit ChlD